jgi:hypothetical protein
MGRLNYAPLRMVLVGTFLAVAILRPLASPSQVTTGTLSGTVTDSSGAVVPGAEVVLNHTETGSARTLAADAQGRYLAPNMALGSYTVQASSQGFQTEIRTGVRLTVGQQAVINFVLNPGAVTESVTITGEAPIVNTTSSAVGSLVNREQIRDLPLNGRDYTQLVLLQPGVVQFREQSREQNRGTGTRMSIAGSRGNQVSYRMNGLDVADGAGATPGSIVGHNLGVDAIQEFQVLTNTFSAEYGKSAGGVINVVHKSGTNNLHGALFAYHRNDNFDANDFFANRADITRPEFKRNQFGASAGGPVIRDKTFFFGAYEGLRERLGITQISLVPSLDARNGIFGTRTVAVSPLTKPYLDAIPLPAPGAAILTGGASERLDPFSTKGDENYVVGKMDHTFSETDTLSGSFTFDQGITQRPAARGGIGMFTEDGRSRNQYVTLRETHTFSPNVINSFNLGFNRSFSVNAHSQVGGPAAAALAFIPGQAWQTIEVGQIDRVEFNFVDNRPDSELTFNTWQWSDNVNLVRGSHSFKMGVEGYRFFFRYVTEGRAGGAGRYVYPSLESFVSNNTAISGQLYEASDPSALGLKASVFQNMWGLFLHDDIRLTPRLTVNAGLRYEFVTIPTDTLPIQGHLDTLTAPQLTVSRKVWGENPSLKGFAPRVGAAWDVFGNQRTAVRGGFGLYYDPLTSYYFLPVIQANPPFRLARILDNAPFPNGLPALRNAPPGSALFALTETDYHPDQPYRIQYNVGVQHQLMSNLSLGAFYVGAQGVHTSQFYLNANTRTPTLLSDGRLFFAANAPLINPNFGIVQYRKWGGHSSYNSLQLQLNKRMSSGFQFQGSYTWSKSLDNGDIFSFSSEGLSTAALQNIFQPGLERGLSAFDVRHNLTANATYDLPTGTNWSGIARTVAGGWQLGGIVSLASGHPFTTILGFDNARIRTRSRGDHLRPDLVAGAEANSIDSRNVEQYFDPLVFAKPETGTLGNLARGSLIGPGFASVDATFKKRFAFGEARMLEFRSEFFNVLNRANFRVPEEEARTVVNSAGNLVPTAGRLSSTTSTPRQIQFSLRYEF